MKNLEQAVSAMFADDSTADVLYATSDGQLFFDPSKADEHAIGLVNKKMQTFYRDPSVREMADKYSELMRMVIATDHLKVTKYSNIKPSYSAYLELVAKKFKETPPVEEWIFNFIASKVYTSQRPVKVGEKDEILMLVNGAWERKEAFFMRRYIQGQIWQVGDQLVLTCPTNTHLMHGSYFEIFSDVLGPLKASRSEGRFQSM